jgi:hypothetical protein
VADATLKAVEHNKAEIDVAPITLRGGALLSQVLPELAGRVARKMGAGKVAGDLAAGQRDKR